MTGLDIHCAEKTSSTRQKQIKEWETVMEKVAYAEKLIKKVIASIEKHGGKDCLSSIILTGSFGRGEPTYTVGGDGELQLKSDVEIALVFPDSAQKQTVENLIEAVSSEFTEDLNLMAINEKRVRKAYNFNFSLRVPRYKTIFTYDLFNGSRTIWGRDFVKENTVTASDVDPYEAKRLVANRIGELVYLQNSADESSKDYLRKQWKGKLILAIVSAWLICEGVYVSSYHGQYQKLYSKEKEAEKTIGKGFLREYEKVFRFLREDGSEYETPDELLVGYVKKMDRYFKQKSIRKPKVNSVSRLMKYTIRYIKTGMKYGLIGFEDNILQALISDYWNRTDKVTADADVWHKVLY